MSGPATGIHPAAGTGHATRAVPVAGPASALAESTAASPVRVALIGTHGFGRVHLENLERLREVGRAELIGVVDLHEPPAAVQGIWHRDLASLLAARADAPPEVVVIATPIDTHLPLALQALEGGDDRGPQVAGRRALVEAQALIEVVMLGHACPFEG